MLLPGFGFLQPSLPGLTGLNWVIVPLLAVAVFLYFRVYRLDGRGLTRRQRTLLGWLRTVVAVLVLLMILRPSLRMIWHEKRLPVVAVLQDESTSMNYPSAHGDPLLEGKPKGERTRFHSSVEALDVLQQNLSLTHRVKVFTFSDTLHLARDIPIRKNSKTPPLSKEDLLASFGVPSGDYTEGGDAAIGVMERLAGDKISAILLLSDGRNTGGETFEAAAESAAQAGVPVHAVTFGSEDPLRDLRVDQVNAPAEASLGDVLEFQVEVANFIQPNLKVDIQLFEQDQLDQTKSVILQKGANRIRLSTIPRVEDLRQYKVVLPKVEDEVDYANNEAMVYVKVVRKALRLLFVAGKPTREYEHVVLCFLRDPIIRASCFLQSAHADYVQQGNIVIDRLPKTNEEWRDYDVILLYDSDPKQLTGQQVSGIEYTVSKGAGLILVVGRNYGFGQMLQIHANKMRQMLPVDMDKFRTPELEKFYMRPWKAERTPEARYHAICRLVADEKFNEEIWSSFPAMYWRHPILRAKPQAVTVLKVAGDVGDLGDCLMAIQRFGEGVSIYLGTDEIWRWRYPYGTHDYDLFWTHIIRYLGETRLHGTQKQVALSTDKMVYAPGEKAGIKLQVLDYALLQQLENENISVAILDSMGAKHVVPMQKDPKGLPFYHGVFPTRYVGPHLVDATHHLSTADSEAKPLYDVKGSFKVEIRSLEALDTRANPEGMQKLAAKTGGTHLDHRTISRAALEDLARSIPAERLSIPHEKLSEIWDTWALLLLILALLTAEWSLRKYWGLL